MQANTFRTSDWCLVMGRHGIAGAVLALALALCAGCGSDGPARYDVSGTVTYAGKPIPVGSIVFEPDQAKGGSGPSGYAAIQDGNYDTASGGKGTIGGPQVVRISGFDGLAKDELADGAPLFPQYTVTIDLPNGEASQQDFDVPKNSGGVPSSTARTFDP